MSALPWNHFDSYLIAGGLGFILGIAFTLGVQDVVRAIHRRRP